MRSDVWSDIDNYRLGHWLTGRIGGCGLAELIRELCRTGGVPLDLIYVTQLAATVPGYAITAIESARASIAPLAQFYGFDVVETGGRGGGKGVVAIRAWGGQFGGNQGGGDERGGTGV